MGDVSLLWIVHVGLLIYAAIQILGSSADTVKKIIWILVVAILPVVGLIIWFFMGPGSPKK